MPKAVSQCGSQLEREEQEMSTFWKIALAVVVLAGLVGIGFAIYRFGYSAGVAENLGLDEFPRFGFIRDGHLPEHFSRFDGAMGRFIRFTDRGYWIEPYAPGVFGLVGPVLVLGFFGLLVVGAIAAIALIVRRNSTTVSQEPDGKSEK
jgi:hypothetical protein